MALMPQRYRFLSLSLIYSGFLIVCLAVLLFGWGSLGLEADYTSRQYCLQIDCADYEDGCLSLSGFAFRYEREPVNISIVLQSPHGKRIRLNTDYGIPRPDVNDYFLCDYDYANTGFTASGRMDEAEEYEVMIQWPWSIPQPTGVFITGSNVHYAQEADFIVPALSEPFVTKGILRLYRPDYHCWVYQYDGSLYWIADEDFNFEANGKTYIQYQTWTTQTQNLPEERLAHNYLWDNIGGNFEDYEIKGAFGPYRVMKRELPSAYALTSIETGYYKHGEWIWRHFFRPYYVF